MLSISESINAFANLEGNNLYCGVCSAYFEYYANFAHHVHKNHIVLLEYVRNNFNTKEDAINYLSQCHRGISSARSLTNSSFSSPVAPLEDD